MSTKARPYKLVRGDFCFVHAMSPILHAYFKEYGQPLIAEDLAVSCFEGKVIKTPLPISKQKCASDQRYHIEIGALNKAGSIFEAGVELLRDSPYFCKDISEPEGWVIQSRMTMNNLYVNNDRHPIASVVAITTSNESVKEESKDSDEDEEEEEEEINNFDIDVDFTENIETSVPLTDFSEDAKWENLNRDFERKYDTAATIKKKPSEEDMNIVLLFIENAKEEHYKYLGSLWLDKFQSFLEQDRTESTVLRPRTPALRTNFFINNDYNFFLFLLIISFTQ